MDKGELENRTKQFAVKVIRFVADLPRNRVCDVVGRQLLESATSIGANYREANRAESRADIAHKIGIVEKEAAETQYWLELCNECALGNHPDEQKLLLNESVELLAIFSAIGKKTKSKNSKSEIGNPK